ncbi:Leucine-rich repeat domain superfamily [Sesbania bispinosa]|nr:Leucine-rich repeat domain superfamily [Sesbania bispinosa]
MKKLYLKGMEVQALPSSFEHQSKLEILCLRRSDIKRLPSCMKKLTRLQYLDIRYCFWLQTIPELPPSFETLLTGGYGQLETVCFPTVGEQLKENRKRVELWDRLMLDEQSLTAIELNARINVEKFAHRHLSAPKHDSDDSYETGYDSDDSYEVGYSYDESDEAVYYVYPGSRVPEWLEHRTMWDSILIDLSSTPCSPHFGFIFCFILGKQKFYHQKLVFEITISDGAGEGNEDKSSATMRIPDPDEIYSDHVCLMYNPRCSHYVNSRAKNLTRFKIKVSTMSRYNLEEKVPVVLKGFGVSPINPLTYQSFSQQMQVCDSISQFH